MTNKYFTNLKKTHKTHMEFFLFTRYRTYITTMAGPLTTPRNSVAVYIKGSQCYEKQPHAGSAARPSYVTPHPRRRAFEVHKECTTHYNRHNRNLVLS